jgi:hypothetical protein
MIADRIGLLLPGRIAQKPNHPFHATAPGARPEIFVCQAILRSTILERKAIRLDAVLPAERILQ